MLRLPIELSTWNGFAGELDAETIPEFRGKNWDPILEMNQDIFFNDQGNCRIMFKNQDQLQQ
jgi:hypothetical protein